MSNTNEVPTLHFFRATPNELMSTAPLCSSLQNLESSFFLVALRRYPHALMACASAIESAIKAAFKKGPRDRRRLEELLSEAQNTYPGLRAFPKDDLDSFRKTRNRVIHYGFSPKDDEETAGLLLGVGFRFLDQCYREFFGFTLREGLFPAHYEQLTIALEVYDKAKNISDLDHTYCFQAFGHLIRWLMKDNFMAYWEFNSAQSADEYGKKFRSCKEHKSELEGAFGLAWEFDCPICSEVETFVCELDDDQIDNGVVSIKRAMCVNCQFAIPHRCLISASRLGSLPHFHLAHLNLLLNGCASFSPPFV
jgi:hypothetical protein